MTGAIQRFIRGEGEVGRPVAIFRLARVSWGLLTQSEKFQYFGTFVIRIIANLLDLLALALSGLLGAMTATGLSGGGSYYVLGFQIPAPNPNNVLLLVGTIAVLVIVRGAFSIWSARYAAIVLGTIEIRNSIKIARYLFSGSLGRLRGFSRAEISFAVNNSTNAAFSGLLGAMSSIIIEVTLFISIFVVFLAVDVVGAVGILLYILLVVVVLQLTTANRFLASGRNIQASTVDAGTSILEMVDAFREIAVLSKQDSFLTRFGEAKKLSVRTGITLQILKKLPRYVAETGLIIGVFLFAAWQLSRGSLADALIAMGIFLAGSFRMMGSILPLQTTWNELLVQQQWVAQAQKILAEIRDEPELLDSRPYSSPSDRAQQVSEVRTAVELEVGVTGVNFRHVGSSHDTISDLELVIPSGAFAAFVGPSGAGKTTIVDLLLGLHEPDAGEIKIGGFTPREIRHRFPGTLSYVPQKPGLVSGSFAGNVALGVSQESIDYEKVRESLRKAELLDFVESLPLGVDTDIGSQADSLSGGQAQRLGLARALYPQPRFLILDEATSALDASTEASIAESIRNIGEGTTVLVVAHRLSTIQHADVVFVVDKGRVIAQGTFPEVRKKVPMIEEYVRLMSFDDD